MPRDYAKRKPAPKKKPQRGSQHRSSKGSAARSTPWLLIIIVIAAIVGFVYFLTHIAGSSDNEPEHAIGATGSKSEKPKAAVSKPKSETLPDKPEERWTFIEELENKEVEVDVPEAPKNTRPYLMQCGSFRIKSQADELKARIAFQGLSSEVRRSEGSKGVWYKVVLGPYKTKRAAERDRHTLQRDKIRGCQIWFW